MTNTLILMFHPNLARSRANAALTAAARTLPDVTLIDMSATYSSGQINMARDAAGEAARLMAADHIVLQFPMQWYTAPPLLQAWQNAVLTRMFYVMGDSEGAALAGVPLTVAVTAGNTPDAYTTGGHNLFTMQDMLTPLRAMAHRCGLVWQVPFVVYSAGQIGDAALADAAHAYCQRLAHPPLRQPLRISA
jgi:glutathione-regulated potassium-efflux system ancillary protein KefG